MSKYNEADIQSNETQRIAQETERINNEARRKTNENEREINENRRIENEEERQNFYNGFDRKITNLEKEIDSLVLDAGNSNPEIVSARTKEDGTSYTTLGDRLDDVDSQLEYNAKLLEKKVYYFDNVENMKDATFLKKGDMAITLGYFDINDGGNAKYAIMESDELEDLGSTISLNNNLKAKLIIGNGIDCRLFGCGNQSLSKDELIQRFDNWVNYVNNTEGKYFEPTGGDTFFIYKPLLLKKSIIGINKPVFMYISSEVGKVLSDTEKSYSGNYGFNESAVIGIKQISESETERLKIKGLVIYCCNGDNDEIASQNYGLYIPEINNFEMSDIFIVRPNIAGLKMYTAWMGEIKSMNVWHSRKDGYDLRGTFTSLRVSNCYAHGYTDTGWNINGAVYSNFSSLASDTPHDAVSSYTIASCWGTNFCGLGSEGGGRESVLYVGDFVGDIQGVFIDGLKIRRTIFENFASSNLTFKGLRYRNLGIAENATPNSFIIGGASESQRIELNIDSDEIVIDDYTLRIQLYDNLGTLIVNKPKNSYSIKQNRLLYVNEGQTIVDLGVQLTELTPTQIKELTGATKHKVCYYRYTVGLNAIHGCFLEDAVLYSSEYTFDLNSSRVLVVRRWDNDANKYTDWAEI